MKYLVVSDIHGGKDSAAKVKALWESGNYTAILSLGDILYHGPRNDLPADYNPKECIALLKPLGQDIINVRGNCDGEVDEMVLGVPILRESNILFVGNRKIFMAHSHTLFPGKNLELRAGDVFLYGHTHIPMAKEKDGIYLCNPGSMTLPKENHPKTYGVLDETGFTIYTWDEKEYMRIAF